MSNRLRPLKGDAPAIRFARLMRQLMVARAVSCQDLATLMGMHKSRIVRWRTGLNMPMHDAVIRLAEILDGEGLVTISLAARMAPCIVCRRPTVSQGRGDPKRFCSMPCRTTDWKRRQRDTSKQTVAVARHRLQDHQEAVAAYCRGCEPEGLCRTAECALRGVSPLPLIRLNRRAA